MAKLGKIMKESNLTLRQSFEVFDQNKDGKIEKSEFMNVFRDIKANLSFAELE
jgi:Ca2+-binding EF-hand superfamily protein